MSYLNQSPNTWPVKTWLAVISLAFGSFGLICSEFLPAALLTPMAQDLRISEGQTGQTVTVTALFAAIAAPMAALMIGRLDRKVASLGICMLAITSNLIVALTNEYVILLIARALLGSAIGGFFALAGAIVVRIVSINGMGRGMSVVFVGISAATVAAPALGTLIGEALGWRSAFVAAAACGAVAFLFQSVCLPRVPAVGATSLSTLLGLLRRSQVRAGLAVALLFFGGHIAGFTFLRPFMESIARVNAPQVAAIFLIFGVSSLIGSACGGSMADRMLQRGFAFTSIILACAALGLVFLNTSFLLLGLCAGAWGLALGAGPVLIQTWMGRAAPDQLEGVGGLFLAVLQFGLVLGASVSGIAVDLYGVSLAFYLAAALAGTAAATIVVARAPTVPPRSPNFS